MFIIDSTHRQFRRFEVIGFLYGSINLKVVVCAVLHHD